MKRSKIKPYMIALAIAFTWLVLSEMEKDDHISSVNLYCENVKDGTWPNYKELDIETECN